MAASDAPPPRIEKLDDDSRALLRLASQILSPRAPAQPLLATLAEVQALETGAIRIGSCLPLVPAPTEQAAHFDGRFGLVRSRDDNVVSPALARASAIATRLRARPGASPGDVEAIAEGLALCVARYADQAGQGRGGPSKQPWNAASAGVAAMTRRQQWDQGHQIFAVLGAETIFTLRALESALRREDWRSACDGYVDAITLFRAIGATMRCTGAMTPASYAVIRRSMEPPRVPAGFSGLWDAAHQTILRLTRTIADLPHDRVSQAMADRYRLALHLLFHAHSAVCERVTGEKASLAAQARNAAPPGFIILRSFARRALRGAGYKEICP